MLILWCSEDHIVITVCVSLFSIMIITRISILKFQEWVFVVCTYHLEIMSCLYSLYIHIKINLHNYIIHVYRCLLGISCYPYTHKESVQWCYPHCLLYYCLLILTVHLWDELGPYSGSPNKEEVWSIRILIYQLTIFCNVIWLKISKFYCC